MTNHQTSSAKEEHEFQDDRSGCCKCAGFPGEPCEPPEAWRATTKPSTPSTQPSKPVKAWAIVNPEGKIICVNMMETLAWEEAQELKLEYKRVLENDGFRCIQVVVQEPPKEPKYAYWYEFDALHKLVDALQEKVAALEKRL